ncbi:hypothetical protein [Geobacillus sp. Sah69]|uniref:hypothetical protein n=1 Tax=Geobacillus sp. Sah69 TaxID=1737624 RepID=UPI000B0DFB98|nr:hypothetical protein [Geobacillus sp. Sah69]
MGMLYKAYKTPQYRQELHKRFVIQRLLELGIDEHDGRSIHELDYDQLKYILTMAKLKN